MVLVCGVVVVSYLLDNTVKSEENVLRCMDLPVLLGLGSILFIVNDFSGTLAYIMVDVNNLKKTNDTLGHQQGDELIRQVARCVQQSVGGRCDVRGKEGRKGLPGDIKTPLRRTFPTIRV